MPTRSHGIAWWGSGAVLALLLIVVVGEILRRFYPDLWLLWLAL